MSSAEKADRYNSGKPQLNYLLTAPSAIAGVCRVFEHGSQKYARDNWKKGLDKHELIDSLLRHLTKVLNGEEIDVDCPITGQKGSGLPHVDHITWNALVLAEQWRPVSVEVTPAVGSAPAPAGNITTPFIRDDTGEPVDWPTPVPPLGGLTAEEAGRVARNLKEWGFL